MPGLQNGAFRGDREVGNRTLEPTRLRSELLRAPSRHPQTQGQHPGLSRVPPAPPPALTVVVHDDDSSSETHPGQAQGGRASPGDSSWAELLVRLTPACRSSLSHGGLSPSLGVSSFADHRHT